MAKILSFVRRAGCARAPARRRAGRAARGLLHRGHAAHRREDRGLPRHPARRHPGLRRPYRRHRLRRDARHRPPARRRGLRGDAALPGPRHRQPRRARGPRRRLCRRRRPPGAGASPAASTARAAPSRRRCSCCRPASSTPTASPHLHVAGHPEGNRDIDPAGGEAAAMAALARQGRLPGRDRRPRWRSPPSSPSTPAPVIAWADRVRAAGITLPVHIGVAGPAKLQTLHQLRDDLRRRPEPARAAAPRRRPHPADARRSSRPSS